MPDSQPTNAAHGTDAAEHNARVAAAIRSYCTFPHKQGYALMVDGPWGSGKTHLVRSLASQLADDNPKEPLREPLYVSLYGVKDVRGINEQLFEQMHPFLGHKLTRLGGRILRGTLKATLKVDLDDDHKGNQSISAQLPELKMSDLTGAAGRRTIVFDDFERAAMPPAEVLGYINPLVENDGCRVIILANEAEIEKGDGDYIKRREKTVGVTLRARADARAALPIFLGQVGDAAARAFLPTVQETLLDVFSSSGLDNLRLLQQVVWDLERIWVTLPEVQRQHAEVVSRLAALTCAAVLELRSGRIEPYIFVTQGVEHHLALHRAQSDPPAAAAAAATADLFKRYPTVDFGGSLIAPETIRDVVLDAAAPTGRIAEQIGVHPMFHRPEEVASWRALWHGFDLDGPSLASVLTRFQQDFDAQTFRRPGEICHVVGLCLWLSDIGQAGWDRATIEERLDTYVDESIGSAPDAAEISAEALDWGMGASYSLVWYNNGDSRLARLVERVRQATTRRRVQSYPAVADSLRAMMTSDSEGFLHAVCFTALGPSTYARMGVLGSIPPGEFADIFVQAGHADQKNIAMAISLRYDQVSGEGELRDELPWLCEVLTEIRTRVDRMDPVPRWHVTQLVDMYVSKHAQMPSGSAGPA